MTAATSPSWTLRSRVSAVASSTPVPAEASSSAKATTTSSLWECARAGGSAPENLWFCADIAETSIVGIVGIEVLSCASVAKLLTRGPLCDLCCGENIALTRHNEQSDSALNNLRIGKQNWHYRKIWMRNSNVAFTQRFKFFFYSGRISKTKALRVILYVAMFTINNIS